MAARRPLALVSGRLKQLPSGDTIDYSLLSGLPTTLAGYGITDGLKLNDTVMNNNAFGGRRLYIANIDNALAAADKRYTVTITTHLQTYLAESYPKLNPDWVASYSVSGAGTSFTITGAPTAIVVYNGTTICVATGTPTTQYQYTYAAGVLTFGATVSGTITAYPDHTVPQYLDSPVDSTLSSATPFDGSYDSYVIAPIGSYLKIRIQASADGNSSFTGYPYGSFFLSYYSTSTGAGTSQYRCYNRNLHAHTIGWKVSSLTDFVGTTAASGYIQTVADELNFGRTILEFIVHSHASRAAWVTEVEWKLTRPAMSALPVVTNYGTNKLHYALTLGAATTTSVTISPTGLIDLNGLVGEPRFRLANTALSAGVDFLLSTAGTTFGIYDRSGTPGWAVQFTAGTRAASFTSTISATGFTGPLTGNATTATTLQNARTIAISGAVTGTATSFNGSANIAIPVTSLNLADAAVTGTLGAARMPALTGDVTTSVGTVATTIAASAVTLAKMANMATASLLGRSTGGTGAPEVLSASTARTLLNVVDDSLVAHLAGTETFTGAKTFSTTPTSTSGAYAVRALAGAGNNANFALYDDAGTIKGLLAWVRDTDTLLIRLSNGTTDMVMNTTNLLYKSNIVYHAGNFDPATKANLTGANFTGSVNRVTAGTEWVVQGLTAGLVSRGGIWADPNALRFITSSFKGYEITDAGAGTITADTLAVYNPTASATRLSIDSSGRMDLAQTFRVSGATDFTTGVGMEMYYVPASNKGYLLSFGRGGVGWKDMGIYGATVELYAGGTSKALIDSTGLKVTSGDLTIVTAGGGLSIAEGSNARMGVVTLANGVATINTTAITANSRVYMTVQTKAGGVVSVPSIYVSGRVAGTSFSIADGTGSALSTHVVAWMLVEPV